VADVVPDEDYRQYAVDPTFSRNDGYPLEDDQLTFVDMDTKTNLVGQSRYHILGVASIYAAAISSLAAWP